MKRKQPRKTCEEYIAETIKRNQEKLQAARRAELSIDAPTREREREARNELVHSLQFCVLLSIHHCLCTTQLTPFPL